TAGDRAKRMNFVGFVRATRRHESQARRHEGNELRSRLRPDRKAERKADGRGPSGTGRRIASSDFTVHGKAEPRGIAGVVERGREDPRVKGNRSHESRSCTSRASLVRHSQSERDRPTEIERKETGEADRAE